MGEPENLTRLIHRAQGDRGRLLRLLVRQQSPDRLPWGPGDVHLLAGALQRVGSFSDVLALHRVAESAGLADVLLAAQAATAAANLGQESRHVETLEQAARGLAADMPSRIVEAILGALGRVYKERANRADVPAERRDWLAKSLDAYERAYDHGVRLWSGVNVAALCLMLGEPARARDLAGPLGAEAALRFRDAVSGSGDEEAHWLKAIEAECALILGDLPRAQEGYSMASALAERRRGFGDVISMRRQARILLCAQAADERLAASWMPQPRIAVRSGSIDPSEVPGNPDPVRHAEAIRGWCDRERIRLAVVALGGDDDLLFAETALRAGVELHLVPVPHSKPAGVRAPDAGLQARMQRVLEQASTVREDIPDDDVVAVIRTLARELSAAIEGELVWMLPAPLL